jgi:hypothetical protein
VQFKEPKTLAFKSLAEALPNPGEFLLTDFAKMERPALLHAAFQALDAFQVCPLASAGVQGLRWFRGASAGHQQGAGGGGPCPSP